MTSPDEQDTVTGAHRDPVPLPREYHERGLDEMRALAHQAHVLREVAGERRRQDVKWGIQSHPDGTSLDHSEMRNSYQRACDRQAAAGRTHWKGILLEEVWEAFAETDRAKLREELVQSAAVIVAWIEDIDGRG